MVTQRTQSWKLCTELVLHGDREAGLVGKEDFTDNTGATKTSMANTW